jgi:hypothetical protein
MLKQPFYRIKRLPTILLAVFFVATLTVSSAGALSSDRLEDNPKGGPNDQGTDHFKWDGHYWWDNENHWRWDGCYWWDEGHHWKWDGHRWWKGKQWWDGNNWRN